MFILVVYSYMYLTLYMIQHIAYTVAQIFSTMYLYTHVFFL